MEITPSFTIACLVGAGIGLAARKRGIVPRDKPTENPANHTTDSVQFIPGKSLEEWHGEAKDIGDVLNK